MSSRPKPKPRDAQQLELDEFAERYETLKDIYRDPVETVFNVMTDPEVSQEVKLRAAEILMSYRFPKLKALEGAPPQGPQLQMHIVIQEPAKPVIDVTPALKALNG